MGDADTVTLVKGEAHDAQGPGQQEEVRILLRGCLEKYNRGLAGGLRPSAMAAPGSRVKRPAHIAKYGSRGTVKGNFGGSVIAQAGTASRPDASR